MSTKPSSEAAEARAAKLKPTQTGESSPETATEPESWLRREPAGSLSRLVRSLPDFEQMVANVAKTVTKLFDAEKAGVMLYDPDTEELVLQRPAFGVDDPQIIDQYRVRLRDGGNAIRVFTTGHSYLSNDCPSDPLILQRYVKMFGSKKVMTVPLRVGEKIIGVLHVTNKRRGDFTTQELELFEGIAEHLGALIDKARLFQRVRRNEHEAETLYALSVELSSLSDIDDMITAALPTVGRLLDASLAGISLHSGLVRIHDLDAGREMPSEAASLGRRSLVSTQRPQSVDDERMSQIRESWQALLSARGLPEMQMLPLASGGKSEGVLFVARRQDAFSQTEGKLLARLAHLMGSVISNAELHQKTEHAYEQLRLSYDRMARVWKIHEELTNMVLGGRGLTALTAAIADLVTNPVLVEDQHGNVLSCAAPRNIHVQQLDPLLELANHDPETSHLVKNLSQLERPARVLPSGPDQPGRMVAPVIVGHDMLAVLSVAEAHRELSDLDLLAVQGAATVVAVFLMRERAVLEAEGRLKGELLSDILRGSGSEEDLFRRASYLGYEPQHPHALLVVHIGDLSHSVDITESSERMKRRAYELVRDCFGAQAPSWLMLSRGNEIVALIPVHNGLEAIHESAHRLHRKLKLARVTVCISRVCKAFGDVPHAYIEVERLLKLQGMMQSKRRLLFVEELGLYRILLQEGMLGKDLIEFAARMLGELEAHDRERDGDLLRCLRVYLDTGGEIKATAKALSMHRNTVGYKLQKIASIIDSDLHDPEVRFQLQLALKIVDLKSVLS